MSKGDPATPSSSCAAIKHLDDLISVFAVPVSVAISNMSPLRCRPCHSLEHEGYEFLHLLLELLRTNHTTFLDLQTIIECYTINHEASMSTWMSRLDDSNRLKPLYVSLDAHRSRLNPLHSNFGNTTVKYWESSLMGYIADDTIHKIRSLLLSWFCSKLLIFAQYTVHPQRPYDVFYIPLFGVNGVFVNASNVNKLSIGITLMPPNYHYIAHHHPAEEIYFPLHADTLWLSRYDPSIFSDPNAKWTNQSIGSVIHHPPSILHAMKTETNPGLALYCWWGDVKSPSRYLDGEYLSSHITGNE